MADGTRMNPQSNAAASNPPGEATRSLKRAFFLSVFAALRDAISRIYYARNVRQDRRHNQALIALARRRRDVLFAMLRDGTFYQPKSAPNA